MLQANIMISGNLHSDTEQLYHDSGVIKVLGELGVQGKLANGDSLPDRSLSSRNSAQNGC
jgi:hypothetical protein